MSASIPPNSLREALVQAFSLDELKALCSDLGINPDVIPFAERGIGAWAREIVLAFQRAGRLFDLCSACDVRRPLLGWDWHALAVEALNTADASTNLAPTSGTSNVDASGSQGASVGNAGKIDQQFGDRQKFVIKPEAGGIVNIYPYPGADPSTKTTTPPAPDDPNAKPPFKGLLYFDVADAALFFGREVLTESLIARLKDSRFLAVIGASGSGKSSLVRAGMVATLWRNTDVRSGISQTHTYILTPTDRPLHKLASELTRDEASVRAAAQLMDDLREDTRALDLYAARLLRNNTNARMLLVVDQFEELFTLCKDAIERKAFIDNLLVAASNAHRGPCYVVLALRADFYTQCSEPEALRQMLEQHQAYIGPMNRDELRRAIEQPAAQAGYTFEPGLVDTLLDDAGSEPGALPLLSHALMETWRRREGRALTLRGYRASGGLKGAIAQTADAVYRGMSTAEQQMTRDVMLRLTALGEGTEDTRRRAALSELTARPDDAEAVRTVLRTLADARLISLDQTTAEVAHEALIREWGQLRSWLDDDRDGLRLHRRLTDDAATWAVGEAEGRDEGLLYRGARLAQVSEWAGRQAPNRLNEAERAFLAASQALAQREQTERTERERLERERLLQIADEQRKNAALERTGRRRFQAFAAIATVIALVAGGLGVVANTQRQRALEQEQLSRARELAAVAVGQIEVDPERAILLSLQAIQSAPVFEAQDALRRGVLASHIQVTIGGHKGSVNSAVFSPDGKTVLTSSDDGTARTWDTETGMAIAILRGHDGGVTSAVFSHGGKFILTSGYDETVRVWEATTGNQITLLRGHEHWVKSLSFSPDDKAVLTSSSDRTARLWEVVTGKEFVVLRGHAGGVNSAAFSPDGKTVLTSSDDMTARIWEVSTGKEIAVLRGHESSVNSAVFSPDGKNALTIAGGLFSGDRIARVWDTTTDKESVKLRGHDQWLNSAVFSPDGKMVLTSSADLTARVWDTVTGREITVIRGHMSGVNSATFSLDGKYILTSSYDRTARIWETETGKEIAALRGHEDRITSATFSADGRMVLTSSTDRTTRVWNKARGKEIAVLFGNEGWVRSAIYSSDGKKVLTRNQGGTVRILDAASGKEMVILRKYGIRFLTATFSSDSKLIFTTSSDETARVWNAETGKEITSKFAVVYGDESNPAIAAFSFDGKKVLTRSFDRAARLWDVGTSKEIAALHGHEDNLNSAMFSPDGKTVLTSSDDGTARIWDSETGKEIAVLRGHQDSVEGAIFSPDGIKVLTYSFDRTARLWNVATGKETALLRGQVGSILYATFSLDSKLVLTHGFSRMAQVWEVATGKEIAVLRGHEDMILTAGFSPDGKLVLTGGDDQTTRIWEPLTGKELSVLRGHEGSVSSALFSPDGKTVLTSSHDGTTRIYVVHLDDLIALAKTRVTRELTCAERVRFLQSGEMCS